MIKDKEGYVLTTADGEATIKRELLDLAGRQVSVWSGEITNRTDFNYPSICVAGMLEGKNSFRVLINDGNYAYFQPADVDTIGVKAGGFKDGSAAVIRLKW